MNKMTPEIALQNLANAAATYRGTLQEHQALQDSLGVIRNLVFPMPASAPTQALVPAPDLPKPRAGRPKIVKEANGKAPSGDIHT